MRPEDKKMLKELIDNLKKEQQEKQTKKAFKFGALTKFKEDLQKKQQAKKEKKLMKLKENEQMTAETAEATEGLLEVP